MASLGSFGMVPTKRALGLEVALGGPVGLAVLGLLGPASGAGEDEPAWPIEELLVELMALMGVLLPSASLAISAFVACSFPTAVAGVTAPPRLHLPRQSH